MNEERIFNLYSVKDELTGKFMQPVFIEKDDEAVRWFKYVLNTTGLWKYNAAMYSLYRIGIFNESKGTVMQPIGLQPELIQGGLSVLDKEE